MRKYSAKQLGLRLGMDPSEVNEKLRDIGLLSGGKGNWSLTEAGKEFGESRFVQTGQGHAAVKGYDLITWSKEVAYKIGDPDKHMREVNEYRTQFTKRKPLSWESDE